MYCIVATLSPGKSVAHFVKLWYSKYTPVKRLFGGDILKVRVNPKGSFVDVAEIKATLQEEIIRGSVMSVSALPQKTETFRIKLKPTTKPEAVYKICRKLNDTGYCTKVISVKGQIPRRITSGLRYRFSSGRYISGSRTSNIIIAKVNTPNTPENPHGLPDPGGKKPKKQK